MQLILCIRNKLNTTQEKGRKKSEIQIILTKLLLVQSYNYKH